MTDNELPRLIGLGGLKRSGKDTIAEHWAAEHGYVVMGMSNPLLDMALVLDPLIPIQPARNLLGDNVVAMRLSEIVNKDGYTKAKEHPEVRRFLQALGTDVGRQMIDEDLWIKQAEASILRLWGAEKRVVLTGIRFPNELTLVKRLGGSLVWIDRPGVEEGDAHASETSVSVEDFSHTIENSSTLRDFYVSGDSLLRSIEFPGIVQVARAQVDEHGYLVAKRSENEVTFYDGTVFHVTTGYQKALLREMERLSNEQPAAHDGRVLSKQQQHAIEKARREGRTIEVTGTSVEIGDFTEEKQSEQNRLLGLLEIVGWTGEIREDGTVNALHPIDWLLRTNFPDGYVRLTKDPHEPLECMKCGARYVNHIQHTKWHDQIGH